MRKIKSVLVTLLTVIMLVSLSLFVACQPNNNGGNSSSTNSNTTSTEQSYTLTFNTDGGDALQNVTAKKDESISLPTPTKKGFIFDGWYLDAEKTNKVTSNSHVVVGDATFYANWVKGITVTLNPNGGKLDTTSVTVKAGAKIADSLTKLIPTYEHHEFDCWLDGDKKLASSKLASEDLTLTASYKVEVSVQIYKQKLDLSGYELAETKPVYAAEKTQYEYKESLQGFKAVANANAVTKITVDADYTKNLVKVYYDRNSYSISFNSHYPVEGMENEIHTESNVLYGSEVDAADSYVCDGYLLVGYSTTPGGAIEYPVNGYKKNLHNAEATDVVETKVPVEKNLMLYGVWAKGYIDMFGSYDSIFCFGEGENKEIYLSRGGIFFKGEVKENGLFEFKDEGNVLLRGKLLSNNTFCYRDANSVQRVKTLFVAGQGLDATQTIVLESYNEFTYKKTNGTGKEEIERYKGSYIYNEESGDYIATFEENIGKKNEAAVDRVGETFHFIMGYAGNQGAYQIRDEEAFAMGTIYRFSIYNGTFAELMYYQATFDGYGHISINMGNQVNAFFYTIDENNVMTLTDTYDREQGTFKLTEFEGKKAYVDYNKTFDRTINVRPSQTATLAMDGIGNAVYTDGATTFTGIYAVSESEFGDYIITVSNSTGTKKFITGTETVEVEVTGEDGKTTTEKQEKAIVTEVDKDYAEYRFTKDTMVYGSAFLVLNAPYAGKASLIFFNPQTGEKETALVGSFALDNTTGRYTFTTEELLGTKLNTSMLPMELDKIKSFTFGVAEANTVYSSTLNYWFSVTDKSDVTTSYEVTYTSTTDASTIKAVGAIATYEYNSNTMVALFLKDEESGLATLSNAQGTILTCEYDEENKTFTKYLYAPHNIALIGEDGQSDGTEYIALDGKGGAVLTYLTGELDENRKPIIKAQYPGKYEETDKTTAFGSKISTFKADDASIGTLNLIVVQSSRDGSYSAFVERNTYKKEYRGEAGILELDGYCYFASYTTAEGNRFNGMYRITAENEILFAVIYQNQIVYNYYIDIKNDTFTVRGDEFGTFIMFDNGAPNDIFVELDGYGKAKLFTFEDVTNDTTGEVTSEEKYIDENATYTIDEETYQVTINYKNGGKYIGELGTYTIQDKKYNVFVLLHEEVSFTYVGDKDWTVMTIDEVGNALIYNKDGYREQGSVTIVDNNLLYFTNAEQTDASLYKFDAEKLTVEKIVYEESFGYFTKELNALLFTKYGFAVFNNETRYYYEKQGDSFFIYHKDPANPNANAYGFVKEEFGEFKEVITWEGKTFYKNSGFDIVFTRNPDSSAKYPVQTNAGSAKIETLIFLPTGEDEFAVTGTIVIGGQQYECQVVRELTESGEFKMYVMIGSIRLYITTDYTGQNDEASKLNYFDITRMTEEYNAQSNMYLGSMDYLISLLFGTPKPVNTIGSLSLVINYNEAGEAESKKITAEFLKDSSLFDRNNKVIELKDYDFTFGQNQMIVVNYTGSDGDNYMLYLALEANQMTGEMGYTVIAFTRPQELKSGDYTVKLERVLYSEAGLTAGGFTNFVLLDKDGNSVKLDNAILSADGMTLTGFVRTFKKNDAGEDTQEVGGSTFYTISLKDSDTTVIGPSTPTTPSEGEGEATKPAVIPALAVTTYDSVEVTAEVLTVYNKQGDERAWIEIDKNNKVICFVTNSFLAETGIIVLPENVVYDEATKTYTIVVSETESYTVQIVDGYAVITKL